MHTSATVNHSSARARLGVVLALVVSAVGIFKAIKVLASPALPILQKDLGATRAEITWVLTGVLLTGPIVTPLVARLGDKYDKKKLLLGVLAVVGSGSLVSALSVSMPMLIIGQLLQGVGLSTVPLAVGIMKQTQPESRVKFGNGLLVAVVYASTGVGLLVAGPIVDHLHYSFLFWFPFMVLVAVLALCWALIPPCPSEHETTTRIDLAGAALFGTALAAFLIALTYAPSWGWTSGRFFGLVAVAVVLLVAFVVTELRVGDPLVDIRILASSQVVIASILMIAAGITVNIFFVSIPMQAQQPTSTGYGLGMSGSATSFILAPGVLVGAAAPVVNWVERFAGTKAAALFGPATMAIGFVCATQSAGNTALAVTSMLCVGFGSGVAIGQAMNLVVANVPSERVSTFTGLSWVLNAVGNTTGTQVAGSILSTNAASASQAPNWNAFNGIFLFGLGFSALTVAAGLFARARRANAPSQLPAPAAAKA
jgi:MFS family permease